jgi:hypothetical protein
VNFFGLAGVVLIVSVVVDNVDAVVGADLDVLVEGGSDDIPLSSRRRLSLTHGELQTIHGPCDQPDQKCTSKM